MSIEEQIQALEARIQACMTSVAGATDMAEQAAQRAELAAQRAELAALGSQQAEVASVVAAEISAVEAEVASVEAEVAVEAAVEIQEYIDVLEDGAEEYAETEESEVPVQLQPGREEDQTRESGLQPGPIVIKVEERHHAEPTLFKRNNTRFRRGRTA